MNILYCGMADDIITPIRIVPDFKKLFVIDLYDSAFSKGETFEEQKQDIMQILAMGNDYCSHHRAIYLQYHPDYPINYLDAPSSIISNTDDGKVWRLTFKYLGIERALIFFHHCDFTKTWDKEIKDIAHLLSIGAEFPLDNPTLLQMIQTRTTKDFKYYDNTYAVGAVKKKVRALSEVYCHNGIASLGVLFK